MPAIQVFEPALCCNTGVCGPDVDQALVSFTADLNHPRNWVPTSSGTTSPTTRRRSPAARPCEPSSRWRVQTVCR